MAKKWLGGHKEEGEEGKYVDLSSWLEEERKGREDASRYIKVAEVQRYEDISNLTKYVYGGDILVLDFGAIAGDDMMLKKMTSDLNALAKDVDGDVAGISENLILVAPSGIKIERKKLRGPRFE